MVERERPGKIVLAANWGQYDWAKVEETIARLHGIGVKDIDLVGPTPQWADSLPRQIYRQIKADASHRIPERMKSGLKVDAMRLDPVLSSFAARMKVNYLSPVKVLCDESGCLARLGNTGDTLTTWDDQHLTEAGSRFLVSHFHSMEFGGGDGPDPSPVRRSLQEKSPLDGGLGTVPDIMKR